MKKNTTKKKKRNISDEAFHAALYKALEERNRENLKTLPPEKELQKEHHFSEEFDKRIMKMYEEYQEQFIPNTRNMVKKSWVLAVSFFIVLTLTIHAGASKFARTHFIIGNYTDHSAINYEFPDMALAPTEILEHRNLDWGEDYEEIGRAETKTSVIVRVSKKNTDIQIRFSQYILSLGKRYINTQYANAEKFLLELNNGKTAFSIIDSNNQFLFWSDGEYFYELQGNCELIELIQLANQLHIP